MIVAVKRNKKQKIVKFISLLVFGCILGSYYYYTSKTFSEQQQIELEDKVYGSFGDIKKRKTNQTRFLSHLQKVLETKIENDLN